MVRSAKRTGVAYRVARLQGIADQARGLSGLAFRRNDCPTAFPCKALGAGGVVGFGSAELLFDVLLKLLVKRLAPQPAVLVPKR
jgi:hypothetical protein